MTPRGILTGPRPIGAHDVIADFSCGRVPLDDWLKQRALRAEGRSARTYVACEGSTVIGYYCFAAGSVRLENVPKPMRRNMPTEVPVVLIGRLAVDARHQGKGLGGALLKDALLRAVEASAVIGVRAVLVHALDDEAAAFYVSYGFVRFPETSLTFFMPIETITAALT